MNLTMIDFAYPVSPPPVKADIVNVYAGGDTPHPMTSAEMEAQPSRYRLPTWVRSNPSGAAQAQSDSAEFISWLAAHKVPKNVTVALDLEVAVNAAYVTSFNNALASAGYRVMKYGSLDYIFKNPKTNGGTWVANPTGTAHMITTGDTVATQYEFAGSYDLSEVLPGVPLWDTQASAAATDYGFSATPHQFVDAVWDSVPGADHYVIQFIRDSGKDDVFHVAASSGQIRFDHADIPAGASGEFSVTAIVDAKPVLVGKIRI